MTSSSSTAGMDAIPRPKMRIVEKPPQGGRPKHQPSMTFRSETCSTTAAASTSKSAALPCSAAVAQSAASTSRQSQPLPSSTTISSHSQTGKSIRPLPSVPQLHTAFTSQSVPHSAPMTVPTQFSRSEPATPRAFVRPLPPTPGPSLPPAATPASVTDAATAPQTQTEGNTPVCASDLTSGALVQAPGLFAVEPLRVVSRASRMPPPAPKDPPTKGPKGPPPALDLPPVGLDRNPTPPPSTAAGASTFTTSDASTTENPASALLSPPSQDPMRKETMSSSKYPDGRLTPSASRSASLPCPPTSKSLTNPDTSRSACLPSPGELDADDVKATRLLEEFRSKPDRGHELMMLASKMSRMWSPTRSGTPPLLVDGVGEWEVLTEMRKEPNPRPKGRAKLKRSRSNSKSKALSGDHEGPEPPLVPPKASRRQQHTLSIPSAPPLSSLDPIPPLPKTAPGNAPSGLSGWPSEKSIPIPRLIPLGYGEDDSQLATASTKFLETLAPSKRCTVLTIISSIAEESILASLPDSDDSDTENENNFGVGGDRDEGQRAAGMDPTVDRKATEIGYEFAKKTGKVDWAPRLIKRLSKKWVREKKGKRWVEDDYSNVLGFLRRL